MEDLAFERPVGSLKERHHVGFCGQNRTVATATVLFTRAREAAADLNQTFTVAFYGSTESRPTVVVV